MNRRVTRLGCWVLGFCLAAGSALAQQRPLLTEDPEPIGDRLVLLEAGVDHTWNHIYPVSGLKGTLLRAPRLGFSFGMGSQAEIRIDGVSISRPGHLGPLCRTPGSHAGGPRRYDAGLGRRGDRGQGEVGQRRRPEARRRPAFRDPAAQRQQRDRTRPRHDRLFSVAAGRQDGAVDSSRRQRRGGYSLRSDPRRSAERRG